MASALRLVLLSLTAAALLQQFCCRGQTIARLTLHDILMQKYARKHPAAKENDQAEKGKPALAGDDLIVTRDRCALVAVHLHFLEPLCKPYS